MRPSNGGTESLRGFELYRSLSAKDTDFWDTPKGITRLIDTLVEDFNHRIVNNALKIVAPTLGAKWIKWILHPELTKSGPCPYCQAKSKGGRDGYYHVTWFMPRMPAHRHCVCEWEIWFESPFK